ncbi:hypothetical protein [Tautonia sociabilis]|uniref:Uncharacterized protein n=1 Tax=Tautonia sociabilis TaxID=2080755 RepID=A0A432MQE8_9BACT|nr:hypothetical protein [Tautonia sociabilis]RUL89711.1 hypothetical protein TsocGM_00670 [Tautonia sociabilis]
MAIRSVVPSVACLMAGLALGWVASSYSTPRVRAGQADRSGESVVATGTVSVEFDRLSRQASQTDALYYLDYAGGRLMATIPTLRQSTAGTQVLGDFAVRDLVADFQPPRGTTPRFLMTVGQLGLGPGGGWAPLFVIETTTGQVATYRVTQGPVRAGGVQPPVFELLELKKLP